MCAAPRAIETQIFATLPEELRIRNRTNDLSKFVDGEFDSFSRPPGWAPISRAEFYPVERWRRGRAAGGSAERRHSLLNAQERGRLAHQPGRPIGSTRAATGVPGVRTPNAVGAAGQSKLAASKRSASPASKLTAIPRDSAIGGPHAQSVGRLGGPAIGQTNHSATIDGTVLLRKF